MKSIKHRLLSLLLTLVTVLSLLPTAAFAASNTGSGLKITTNQAYWSTRLLANGTPYSYRPPLVDGKLVYCMDILEMGETRFRKDYCKWAEKKGYRNCERMAALIFATAQNGIPVLPNAPSTQIVITEAIRVLHTVEASRDAIRKHISN